MNMMDWAGLRHTTTTYNDSTQTALTKRDLTNALDGLVQSTTFTDDLGRVWQTHSTDGTSCTGGIQTLSLQQTPAGGGYSYQLSSNPFCTTADATMGWTRAKLDPLGRVVEVAHFSGSALPAPLGHQYFQLGSRGNHLQRERARQPHRRDAGVAAAHVPVHVAGLQNETTAALTGLAPTGTNVNRAADL